MRYSCILLALALALLACPAPADTIEYLHTDLLGNVVVVTDENANVIERRSYEPYGLPTAPIADGPGYTGHVHDGASGLIYMQQRYYDPEVGQFLSPDPMAVDPATAWNFNRYNYAANNPYKYWDPDGRCPAGASKKQCIHAEHFDASRSSGRNAAGTTETDGAARGQRNVVRASSSDVGEKLGSINRQENGTLKVETIAGATTGQTNTADTASGIVPSNSVAIIHGHISSSVNDDPASRGDAAAVLKRVLQTTRSPKMVELLFTRM